MWKCYRCGPTYGTVQYLLYYTRVTDWSRAYPSVGPLTHPVHTGALGGAGGGDAWRVVVVCACVCVSTRPRSVCVCGLFGRSLLRAAEPAFNVGKARNGRWVGGPSLAASEHPTMLPDGSPRLMATHAHTARTRTSILGCFHIRADYCLWAAAARREAPRRSSHRLVVVCVCEGRACAAAGGFGDCESGGCDWRGISDANAAE